MKILVTGGSGLIGSYVLRSLKNAGHVTSSYSRQAPRVTGVEFIQGDIMQLEHLQEALAGHEAVIHLAAVPGPGRASPQEMVEINVVGTVHVLEGAIRSGVDTVVLASSGAATGFSFQTHEIVPGYLPIDEDHPCQPQDEYGLSKLLAEITCKRYSDAYGLRTICLRINNNWYLKREEAEVATQSGWATGLTVEEIWTARYRKTIEDNSNVEWPVPGPPPPQKILWAFTDARDAAEAFRLAAENKDIIHEVFLINGHDTCTEMETPQILARHYPDVPLKTPLKRHASLWSYEKATRILGYQPQYTWRQSDFSDWLANITREESSDPG